MVSRMLVDLLGDGMSCRLKYVFWCRRGWCCRAWALKIVLNCLPKLDLRSSSLHFTGIVGCTHTLSNSLIAQMVRQFPQAFGCLQVWIRPACCYLRYFVLKLAGESQ